MSGVTYKHDDADTARGIPGGVGLKIGMIRQFRSIKSLCFHTLVKAKIGDADTKPGQEARNGCYSGEVGENYVRTFLDTDICKERKARIE